jgi:hypothetical protein
MDTKLWSGNLKGRDHVRDQGTDEIISNLILQKENVRVWTGFIWLRRRSCEGLLRIQQ